MSRQNRVRRSISQARRNHDRRTAVDLAVSTLISSLQIEVSLRLLTMSATSRVLMPTSGGVQVGAIAHVHFRVRCEALGHGEEVFLAQEGDTNRQRVRYVGSCLGGS